MNMNHVDDDSFLRFFSFSLYFYSRFSIYWINDDDPRCDGLVLCATKRFSLRWVDKQNCDVIPCAKYIVYVHNIVAIYRKLYY